MNSETKKVGDAGNSFIKNEANQDLKLSHMPFAHLKGQMSATTSRHVNNTPGVMQGASQVAANSYIAPGRFSTQFKAEPSRLPFSATQRFGADNARNQYDSFNKT